MKKSKQSSNEILAGGNIKRLFTAPMIICLVLFALFMFSSIFSGYYEDSLVNILRNEVAEVTLNATYTPSYYLAVGEYLPYALKFFGMVFAGLQFNFMLNKKHCYTQLSFAVGRSQLYRDKVFFPVIIALGITILLKLCAVFINIRFLGFSPNLLFGFLTNTLLTFKPFLEGYAIVVVSHMLAARHTEAYLLALSIYQLPQAIVYMANSIFSHTLYGYAPYEMAISSNSYYHYTDSCYPFNNFPVYEKEDFTLGLSNVVFTVILCTIAFLICKYYFVNKFKAENCGVRGKYSVALILSCLVLPISFLHTAYSFGYYSNQSDFGIAVDYIAILLGTAIAAILICLAVTWSPKKIKVGLIAAGVGIGIQILTMIIGATGCFGYDAKLPESNEIKAVQISLPFEEMGHNSEAYNDFFANANYDFYYDDLSNITLLKPEEIDLALNIHKTAIEDRAEETTGTCHIIYYLKDGSTVTRSYQNMSKATIEKSLGLWKTQAIQDRLAIILNQRFKRELAEQRMKEGYFILPDHCYDYETDSYINGFDMDMAGSIIEDVFISPSSIVNFTDICFISKDYNVTKYTSIESDTHSQKYRAFTTELQTAIYKDAIALSPEEWFRPEKQLGVIAFEDNGSYSGQENTTLRYGYTFYLNSSMKNTLKVLEKHNLMKCFENTREIEKAFIVDIEDAAQWLSQGEKIHNIYFSQNSAEIQTYITKWCGYTPQYDNDVDDWYDDSIYAPEFYGMEGLIDLLEPKLEVFDPKQTEITDKEKIRQLVDDAHMAYAVGDKGKFLIVRYSRQYYSMLVLPE